jgi:hypothetical protein
VPINDLSFVQGLSGEEIIQDLCAALAEKLRTDCNLRGIDQYSGGYKASIPTIHIECFGLDAATVDYNLEVENTTEGQDETSIDFSLPDVDLDTELEVPVETNLQEVRDRSDQVAGDFEMKPALEITEEGPVDSGQPQKRKYTRRLKALVSAQGGATGQLEE